MLIKYKLPQHLAMVVETAEEHDRLLVEFHSSAFRPIVGWKRLTMQSSLSFTGQEWSKINQIGPRVQVEEVSH